LGDWAVRGNSGGGSRGRLPIPLEQTQRGRGDRHAIRLGQERLECQDLAVEGSCRDLAPELGPHRLVASPGGFGRTRKSKWPHRTGGEGNQMRQLAWQQQGNRPPRHTGHGLDQLSWIMRQVEKDEERRVVRNGASDDAEGSVVAVVSQQEERLAYRALALVAAHVDRRGRRIDLIEHAAEDARACRGCDENVPERDDRERCRGCTGSVGGARGRATVRRLCRRAGGAGGPEPRGAARVALDEILDCGVELGREDGAGRVFRHLGHDRFQIRAAARGEYLVGPGDAECAHVAELERGSADECHDLGGRAHEDGSGSCAQHSRGSRRAGCGHDARRYAAAGADERISDTDGGVRVSNEHDRLDLLGLSGSAIENPRERARRRVPIRGHDVHGVLPARDTDSFRRFVFHLTPAM
jgi:hypothetical protein